MPGPPEDKQEESKQAIVFHHRATDLDNSAFIVVDEVNKPSEGEAEEPVIEEQKPAETPEPTAEEGDTEEPVEVSFTELE